MKCSGYVSVLNWIVLDSVEKSRSVQTFSWKVLDLIKRCDLVVISKNVISGQKQTRTRGPIWNWSGNISIIVKKNNTPQVVVSNGFNSRHSSRNIPNVSLSVTGCCKIIFLYIGSSIHSKMSFTDSYYDVKKYVTSSWLCIWISTM